MISTENHATEQLDPDNTPSPEMDDGKPSIDANVKGVDRIFCDGDTPNKGEHAITSKTKTITKESGENTEEHLEVTQLDSSELVEEVLEAGAVDTEDLEDKQSDSTELDEDEVQEAGAVDNETAWIRSLVREIHRNTPDFCVYILDYLIAILTSIRLWFQE